MQTGDKIDFGDYKWRVLDVQNGAALLITDTIIAQHAFHDARGDVTWAGCAIRKYLNGEFYDGFAAADQARIIPVTNKNLDNPWYGANGGADTQDCIFLLSLEEAVCKYFGDSSTNLENRSPKQRYWFQKKDVNNEKRRATFLDCRWWWWLRSPGRDNRRAIYIHGDGNIGIQGNGTFRYSSNTLHRVTGRILKSETPDVSVYIKDCIHSLPAEVQDFTLKLHQRYLKKGLTCTMKMHYFNIAFTFSYKSNIVWELLSLTDGCYIVTKAKKLNKYADDIKEFPMFLQEKILRGYGCEKKRFGERCQKGCHGFSFPLDASILGIAQDIEKWLDKEASCLRR